MTGVFSLVYRGWAASFKSRHQLLLENWALRHQLYAAQQNLLRAGLNQARVQVPSSCLFGAGHRRGFSLFGLFGPEEPRICLVLVTIALVMVTANAIRSVRTFSPTPDSGDIWAELDSFSEPAVAEAVLRREAESLLVHYADSYSAHLQARDTWKRSYADWLAASGLVDEPSSSQRYQSEHGKMPAFDRDAWIARLKGSLFSLRESQTAASLEQCLLLLYEQSGLWSEFIDLYLDIVRRSPSNLHVVSWAEPALQHASEFGRADQVLAYLQFAAQYDPHHLLTDLAPILKRWSQPTRVSNPLAFDGTKPRQPTTL